MKNRFFGRVTAAALALMMVCGVLFAALPLSVGAAESDPVTEYSVDNLFTPDWKGSEVGNGGYSNFKGILSEKEAAGGKAVLEFRGITQYESYEALTESFVTGYAFDSENGNLYFQGSLASNVLLLTGLPSGIQAGGNVLRIKFYVDPDNFAGFGLAINSSRVSLGYVSDTADANGEFPLYWDNTKTTSWVATDTGLTAKAGWNVFTLITMPVAEGETAAPVYVALESGETSALDVFTEESLAINEDVYKATKKFPTTGLSTCTANTTALQLRTYNTAAGILQLGGVEVHNLTVKEVSYYEVTFEGYEDETLLFPADGEAKAVTMPTFAGVNGWMASNGKIYTCGQTAYVTGEETFTPITDFLKGYTANVVYTADWSGVTELGATSIDDTVTWNSGLASKFSFDDANDAIVITGLAVGNEYPLYVKNNFTGAAGAMSFDIHFDATTFAGFKITAHAKNSGTAIVSIAADGTLENTDAKLAEGWNTVVIYALPVAEGLAIYVTISNKANPVPTLYGYGITDAELTGIYNNTFTGGATAISGFGYNDKISVGVTTKDTYDDTNYKFLKIRNIQLMDLVECDRLLKVTYTGAPELTQYVDSDNVQPLTIADGLWTLDGEYLKAGDTLTIDGVTTLAPVKLTGANLTLGSEVTMNMFINASVVNAYGADGVTVISDGTIYEGVLVGDRYVFAIEGIRAIDMDKQMSFAVALTFGEETVASFGTVEYSPLTYARRMYAKESSSEALKSVLVTMVQYAYAAEVSANGSSAIIENFNNALGTTLTFSTDAYTQKSITVDTSAVSGKVIVGATLTSGIQLQFQVTEDITALEVAGVGTFEVENGIITVDELHAGMLTTKLNLTFVTAEGNLNATYCIANFLDSAAVSSEYTQAQQQLAMATSIYMSAVADYVAGK